MTTHALSALADAFPVQARALGLNLAYAGVPERWLVRDLLGRVKFIVIGLH